MRDLTSAKRAISVADVDQVYKLNRKGDYDGELANVRPSAGPNAGQAAAFACLGSAEDRGRMLQALASADERDIEMAEGYFQHRPIVDAEELRVVARGIVKLGESDAQVRALHALARQPIADAKRSTSSRACSPWRNRSPCSGRSRASSSAPIPARSPRRSLSACSASTGRPPPRTTSSTC